ncbi:hypothetical protein Ndes2526B_g03162 [Nannochloris sp. 'desiccata']
MQAYSILKAKTFLCGTCVPQTAILSQHRRSHRPPAQLTTTYASAADVAGLIVFSAIPFVAVQALADSKYGKKLLEDLKAQRSSLVAAVAAVEKSRAVARSHIKWYGPNRPQWLGPFSQQTPEWLDGVLPGDYGYDPLALGRAPEKLHKYVELELLHARWAMLGGLGALIPEAVQLSGKAQFLEPVWWRVGAAKLHSTEDLNYLGIAGLKVAGGQGVLIIAICQVLLMFGPEYARACGIEALEPLGIFLPGDKNYPGGVFDPLGLAKDPSLYETMRIREIKNGRLAMVAWLGFAAQAAVTEKGPLENLVNFLDDASRNIVLFDM